MQTILKKKENYILLIEKDEKIANMIRGWLDGYGKILHISSVEKAKHHIENHTWSLVITDSKVAGLNDIDITKLVKENDPLTSVLIVTQHQKIDFILQALQHHADGLLFKPLEKNEFTELAVKLINESHARRKREGKVILAIGAHPDDVEIGCGGTLARHREKGDSINILTLSSGHQGGYADDRVKEAKCAAEIQGAHLFLGELNDTSISEGLETIQLIEKIVTDVRPTYVYTHSIHDGHQDHRNTFRATVTACRSVTNLFCYQSPSGTVQFQPNLFVNIDDYLEAKLKALSFFKSQISIRPYLQKDLIKATAQYWGRYCSYGLAEPFEAIRQESHAS